MTEYWKSNPRKFCDYCKCWFADDKPSIQFHESGKNHKDNVAKRLKEISRKGREDHDNNIKTEDFMMQMEKAALEAYKADISSNPDMTGSTIASIAKEKNADIIIQKDKKDTTVKEKNTKWYEAKTGEGMVYFYHCETKATKWEAPKEGFYSLDEQKLLKSKKKKDKKDKNHPRSSKETSYKSTAAKTQPKKDTSNQSTSFGSWTTVEKPVMPDLQLPKIDGEDYFDYSLPYKEPKTHSFTQKTVTLGESSSTQMGFKKRKNADSNKKNARARMSDL